METKEDAVIFTIILQGVEKRRMLSEVLFQKSCSNHTNIHCINSPDTTSKMIWKKSGNISNKFGTRKTDQVRKNHQGLRYQGLKYFGKTLNIADRYVRAAEWPSGSAYCLQQWP